MDRNYLKKRLIYVSNNRGLKETDIILGEFVKNNISQLSEEHLKMLESLLMQPDIDIYNWITNKEKTPKEFDNQIMNLLRSHVNS